MKIALIEDQNGLHRYKVIIKQRKGGWLRGKMECSWIKFE